MSSPTHLDVVDNGAIVKVFLLEAPYPWNAPLKMQEAAGSFWKSYALTHAALGFMLEESGEQFVIDFHADDYVGSFLPKLPEIPQTPAPTPSPSSPITAAPTIMPTTPSTMEPSVAPDNGTDAGAGGKLVPMATPTTPELGNNVGSSMLLHSSSARQLGEALGVSESLDAFPKISATEDRDAAAGASTTDVTWHNAASVRFLTGFNPDSWSSANYVGKITGLLYNDLLGWAQLEYGVTHTTYQSLSACRRNTLGTNNVTAAGSADSYDFVWAAFERLASEGVLFEQTQVVLPQKRTFMCLFADEKDNLDTLVPVIGNNEAERYFRRTNNCVKDLAAAAAAGNISSSSAPSCSSDSAAAAVGEGAVSVLLGLGSCLENETFAYLYHNETSYRRITLPSSGAGGGKNMTASVAAAVTPNVQMSRTGLVRIAPGMPPSPTYPAGSPSDRAYFIVFFFAVLVFGLMIYAACVIFRRKRRNIGFYGSGSAEVGNRGGLFSSSAGAGWRSGGGIGHDFGTGFSTDEFTGDVGDAGFQGAMFPEDSFASSTASGSGSRQGRKGWRSRSSAGPSHGDGGDTVELKRPLLTEVNSPPDASFVSAAPRRGRGQDRNIASSLPLDDDMGARVHESSPPPFARMAGGGPGFAGGSTRSGRRRDEPGDARDVVDASAASDQARERPAGDDTVEQGPFGDDPFVSRPSDRRPGGRSAEASAAKSAAEIEEGDEVFC